MSKLMELLLEIHWLVLASSSLILIIRFLAYRYLSPITRYSLWISIPLTIAVWLLYPEQLRSAQFYPTQLSETIKDTSAILASTSYFSFVVSFYLIIALALFLFQIISLFSIALQSSKLSNHRFSFDNRARLKVLVSENNIGPAVFGLLSPKLLLPKSIIDHYTHTDIQLILKHEQVHWQRRDPWLNALGLMLRSLCWINPLAWYSFKLFQRDQEIACDAAVCARFNAQQKAEYATLLLSQTSGRTPALLANWASPKLIKERIMNIKTLKNVKNQTLSLLFACSFISISATAFTNANKNEEPLPLTITQPSYPVDALKNNIEGYVRFSFDLDGNGNPTNINIVESSPDNIFDNEAMNAISKWKFNQKNVKDAYYTLEFKLQ
ncbi:MAG: TonB family protein [Gammaproteobacteria bacterium]|nr:TonB family protein [Gammaproteobacteria bacterium]